LCGGGAGDPQGRLARGLGLPAPAEGRSSPAASPCGTRPRSSPTAPAAVPNSRSSRCARLGSASLPRFHGKRFVDEARWLTRDWGPSSAEQRRHQCRCCYHQLCGACVSCD
jgi:hypothetical protein